MEITAQGHETSYLNSYTVNFTRGDLSNRLEKSTGRIDDKLVLPIVRNVVETKTDLGVEPFVIVRGYDLEFAVI
jgi:hypothetical protein